jgi:Putative Flp pilus-assembly TadE/G-like
VIVMVALWLPIAVLLAAFVVDIANWFVHRRHLQMQADAAALAAAADYIPGNCNPAALEERARQYGGFSHNPQIGGTPPEEVHLLMNSPTWHGQTTPVDTTVSAPCSVTNPMVDVKLTETNLPWFLDATNIVSFINARARVSILEADTIAGALPVGVPDSRPQKARVTFIDEADGTVLGARELQRTGQSGGYAYWDNTASPLPVNIDRSRIGVRVALSGGASLTCGDPLVDCYDLGSANGLLFIRGWSTGTVTPAADPEVGDVRLTNETCAGAYFSSASASCTIGIRADVEFGTATPVADVGAGVEASVAGQDSPLSYDAATGLWVGAGIEVPAQSGPVNVDLKWRKTTGTSAGRTCNSRGNNPCQGTFSAVQRIFSANEPRSGPIKGARVFETSDPVVDANSFQRCATCSHDLVVELKLVGSLEDAADVNDPPVALRVVGGSQNQSLDCDPDTSNLKNEIATGCAPSYTKNTGTACPAGNTTLWASPQPWPCVGIQTGSAVNQVAAGMNLRVLGDEQASTCTSPNSWSSFPNIPDGDPRIVQVFLTPFGSFTGTGNMTFPVTGFATFYVTGWSGQGQGFANPCEAFGDDPVPNGDGGFIIGHFIKYVSTLNNGSGSQGCSRDTFGTCIAVMTE